ncbi:MAG: MiaB/RimO family radical SAM methylthiotransferase, partial [Thermoanaerobaculia bacterium]
MRVFFSNLGCKLNQAELEHLAREFRATGHTIASSLTDADLHVVNSCTVTHVAARDSRKLARRGRRLNPAIRTVLTGCYVTAEPEEASGLTGVDLIVPNEQKDRLVEHVHRAFPEPGRPLGVTGSLPIPFVPLEFGNSRALVKVEDGCNMRCSFCVIPFTRGRQRSRPLDEVVREVEALCQGGFHEVVVTGVQISSYRDGASGLFELVEAVLAKTAVARLRLTSIAPWQFDHRLLDLFSTGRLCRHFHLSLQSGCARTLNRMRRPYAPQEYAELASAIREKLPGAAITTDLIVGFPGELDRDFEDSLDFCKATSFARVHA